MSFIPKKQIVSRLSLLLPAFAGLVPFAQAQNVGIGTAAPASKLTVNGNLAVGAGTPWTTTAAPAGGAIIQGTVGIGTETPEYKLHVVDGPIRQSNTTNANYTQIGTGGGVRCFRDGAASPTFRWVYGYVDLHDNALSGGGDFAGRMFYYSGVAGEGAAVNEGEGLAFSVAPLTSAPHLLVSSATDSFANVGIGDTTPTEAKLVVRGGMEGTSGGTGQRFGPQTAGVVPAVEQSGFVSIYAANQVWAVGNIVTQNNLIATSTLNPSDSRLKNIIGVSDAAADLETLGKIRVTDYTLKDTAAARGTIKKVVAQQVEEVYPRAVSKSTGWLPDIQAFGAAKAREKGIFEISMERPHGVATGAKLKIIVANGEAEYATVQSVTENTFTAKLEQTKDGDRVFVYGRQTDDLRAVDYDALSMLNISATQELARRLQTERAENEAQRTEIAALKAQLSSLQAQNDRLAALTERMESLEKIVRVQSADKEAGTPVLAR